MGRLDEESTVDMKAAAVIAVAAASCLLASGVVVDEGPVFGFRTSQARINVDARSCLATVQTELASGIPVGQLPKSLDDVREPFHPFRVEGTSCARGAPFAFSLAKKDPKKLMIVFVGGGGCWDFDTCCGLADEPFYDNAVDLDELALLACLPELRLEQVGLFGILSDVPENPARDFSILLVPYCSADFGMADTYASYAAVNGASCGVEHRGANNTMTAVDWALSVFSNGQNKLTDLIVAGDSAGAYSARFVAPIALNSLAKSQPNKAVKATLLVTGAVGLASISPSWELGTAGLWPKVFAKDADHPQNTGQIGLKGLSTDLAGLDTDKSAARARDLADLVYAKYQDNMQVLEMSHSRDSVQLRLAERSADILATDNDCGSGEPCSPARLARFQKGLFSTSASERSSYAGNLLNGTDHNIATAAEFFELGGENYQGPTSTALGVGSMFQQSVNRRGIAPVKSFQQGDMPSESPPPGEPSADPSPTAVPAGAGAATCFPADAEVETARGTVRMDELAVGDHVRVGAEQWSEVFMFTHQHREVVTEMVRLEASGRRVELSGTHYLQIGKELRAARAVEVGDTIELGNGTMAAVTGVRTVQKRGLYNPQTLDGDIVVNGIRASTFTETVEPRLARMLLVVPKALYRLGVWNPFGGMFLEDNRLAAKLVPRGATRQVIV